MTRRGREGGETSYSSSSQVRTSSVLVLWPYTTHMQLNVNALRGNMISFVLSSLCQFSGWGMLPVNNITKTNRNIIWHQTLNTYSPQQSRGMTRCKLHYLLTVAHTVSPVFIFFGLHFVLVSTFLCSFMSDAQRSGTALYQLYYCLLFLAFILDIRREDKSIINSNVRKTTK